MASRKPASARRLDIAGAALRVIAEQGLARFTSLAIAREVGLSDAALFRHFPTKEAIVLAAIERVEAILFEGFPPAGRDPIERLGRFFAQRVRVIRENPGIARVIASDQLAQAAPAAGAVRVAALRRRSVHFVADCLEQARQDGLLAAGVSADEASILVLGSILALTQGKKGGVAGPTRDLPERVWRTLEAFLRGNRAAPSGRETPSLLSGGSHDHWQKLPAAPLAGSRRPRRRPRPLRHP